MLGLALDGDRGVVQIFPLRGGKMIDRYSFHLENVEEQDVTAVLESFCVEYYGATPSVPPQIVVPQEAGDLSALEQFLTERRGSRVEVRRALRGEKRRLAELAAENAQQALTSAKEATATRRARRAEALEELREALNLESLPLRIECYDISTIQGVETVGSMVVFEDAAPKKAHYRKFAVRSLDGAGRLRGDGRGRLAPLRAARPAHARTEYDESFVAAPNLVVIDGGKGQLSAALAAMQAVRPAARRGDRAGEAGRGGLRAGTPGSDRPRPALAGAAAPAADPRRGAPLRARLPPPAPRRALVRDDLRHAAGRRPGAAARDPAPLRLAGAVPRGVAGGARRRPRAPRRDRAQDLRAAAQGRPRADACGAATGRQRRLRRVLLERDAGGDVHASAVQLSKP